MAELICNAYYKGGVYRNGNGATPFALKMLVGADQKALSSTVFLTQRYARVLGIGRIRRLEPEGVVFCSGESELPSHILVRTNKLFYRIFMAPPEMQSLSEHFRLPIGVLNGALFSIAKGQKWTRNLEINLCWNRLLDPEWGRAFLRWLSKEGPLPQTLTLRRDEVPQWTEPEDAVWKAEFDALVSVTPPAERSEGLPWTNINSAHIDMPGLPGPQSFQFHDTRIERSGVLRFRRLYEHAIAYFHFRERDEDCVAGFSLFPDQFRRIGRAVEGESFDTILLQEMTGRKPTFLKYCFCKATDSDGIMRPGFVNKSAIEIRGSRRDSKVFAPHTQYYWKIVRENGSSNARLLIYCYTEPEMQEASLFAVGTTNLKSGSISGLITLYPPEQIIS